MGIVRNLYHYPVKGLSPQPLESVEVCSGQGFPHDRIFGIARADSGFDPLNPRPMSKSRFFMLMRDERLAGLETRYEPGTGLLTIRVQGRLAHESSLSTAEGTDSAVAFFATMFDLGPEARPLWAKSESHRFTDVSVDSPQMMNAISLINQASVEDLATRICKPVDPMRFRANLYLDGWPPFEEFRLCGREIRAGGARLRILKRTSRCAATEVNPRTARRDLPIPRLLVQHYGHADMGVYAEVVSGGAIRIGDPIHDVTTLPRATSPW